MAEARIGGFTNDPNNPIAANEWKTKNGHRLSIVAEDPQNMVYIALNVAGFDDNYMIGIIEGEARLQVLKNGVGQAWSIDYLITAISAFKGLQATVETLTAEVKALQNAEWSRKAAEQRAEVTAVNKAINERLNAGPDGVF